MGYMKVIRFYHLRSFGVRPTPWEESSRSQETLTKHQPSKGESSVKKWLCLLAAIVSEVSATVALKAALERPAWYVLVVVGYAAAFAMLAVCLRLGMTISVAYGVWGAGGIAATALLAAVIYGEPLTSLMLLGILLILFGVVTIEVGPYKSRHVGEGGELP